MRSRSMSLAHIAVCSILEPSAAYEGTLSDPQVLRPGVSRPRDNPAIRLANGDGTIYHLSKVHLGNEMKVDSISTCL